MKDILKKNKLTLIFLLIIIFGISLFTKKISADFSISPSSLTNFYAKPGSELNYELSLSTNKITENCLIIFQKEPSEINDWLTLSVPDILPLKKPETTKIFSLRINVPKDAFPKEYYGNISIQLQPENSTATGNILQIGTTLVIKLKVTTDDYENIVIRSFKFLPSSEDFPLELVAKIENLGNITSQLSRIELAIQNSDNSPKVQLITENIPSVEQGTIKEILVKIPHTLKEGEYFVNIKGFFKDLSVREEKILLTISPNTNNGFGLIAGIKTKLGMEKFSDVEFILVFSILLICLGTAGVYIVKKYRKSRKLITNI